MPWLRRNVEISSLLFLALVVFVIWAFAELADEVVEGATHDFDRDIPSLPRTPEDIAEPPSPLWLQEMTRDVTALVDNAKDASEELAGQTLGEIIEGR